MAKSNAERQREYKRRALKDPDGLLLTRLEVLIDPAAAGRLDRLAKAVHTVNVGHNKVFHTQHHTC